MICSCGNPMMFEHARGTIEIAYSVSGTERKVKRFVCSFACFANVLEEQAKFVRICDQRIDSDDVLHLATMLPARGGQA